MLEELSKKAKSLKKAETNEKSLMKMVGSNFAKKPHERRCVL